MLSWFKKKKKKEIEPDQAVEVQESPVESIEEELETQAEIPSQATPVIPEPDDKVPEASPVPEATAVGEKGGLFQRLKRRLAKTRDAFVERVDSVFLGKKEIDDDLLDELEEVLITADLGYKTVQDLLSEARKRVSRKELTDPQALREILQKKILEFLQQADKPSELVMPEQGPFVIMVLGVNGVGKTTTIGKLAHKFTSAGQKVLLVAADTFRAAAIDQLKIWGERVGVEVSAQQQGADPSSVVFDAFEYAKNRNYDVIIVDTAGRLHTKVNLMEELKKIKRVMDKKIEGSPHEILMVLDATTGQNAVSQAKMFHQAVDVTGIALTKLDGTAKGGIVINISREFNIPIRFIGIGEQMEDLRDFSPKEFVDALFSREAG